MEFNTISGVTSRSKEVLRKNYENLKKRVQKQVGDEKCFARGTGGGPPLTVQFSEVKNSLKDILGVRTEWAMSTFDNHARENKNRK